MKTSYAAIIALALTTLAAGYANAAGVDNAQDQVRVEQAAAQPASAVVPYWEFWEKLTGGAGGL